MELRLKTWPHCKPLPIEGGRLAPKGVWTLKKTNKQTNKNACFRNRTLFSSNLRKQFM